MKLHKLLAGTVILLFATLLVACQNNSQATKQTTETSISTAESSEEETLASDRRERLLKKFYAELPETMAMYYLEEIEERSEKAWEQKQPNIFAGQESTDVISSYLPKELNKLSVEINGYDVKSRRLIITVTNNYDTALKGADKNTEGDYLYGGGTQFALFGFPTVSGKASKARIVTIHLVDTLEAGESIQLKILPRGLLDRQTDYAKSLQDEELDSQYLSGLSDMGKALWDVTPDQVMGEELDPHDLALSNLANIYIVPSIVFESFPSTVPDVEELLEKLSEYRLSTY